MYLERLGNSGRNLLRQVHTLQGHTLQYTVEY